MPYGVTSQYPTAIVSNFQTHANQTDIVDASHPNIIQAEVYAIEATLGLTPENSGTFNTGLSVNSAGSSTPSISTYVYTGYTTFNTVSDRITNVENLAATALTATGTITALTTQVNTNQTSLYNSYAIAAMGGF